jgi:transposase
LQNCVVSSVVILLDRESEEAAVEDGLGRTWSSPSVRRDGWFLLDRGITRFSLHFNERGPDGLLNGKSPGQPSKLNDVQRQAIARMIESGPIPAVHGVVRWRLIDLAEWFFEEFRIAIAKQTLSRELRAMGYRKLSARPRHYAQAAGAIEDFKKASPRAWTQSRVRRRSASTR